MEITRIIFADGVTGQFTPIRGLEVHGINADSQVFKVADESFAGIVMARDVMRFEIPLRIAVNQIAMSDGDVELAVSANELVSALANREHGLIAKLYFSCGVIIFSFGK
jgi:hypothetical protein